MANLLLVDDDALTRQILADLVKSAGHSVVACADARSALEALSGPRDRFRAVVADVRMPGTDGIDLARRIMGKLPELPIALMSAEPDFDIYEEALTRGVRATVLLQKPFDARSVQRVLDQLLGGRGVVAAAPAPVPGSPQQTQTAVPLGKDDALIWLSQESMPISRLPPVRLWFVAARRRATGNMVLDVAGGKARFGLRGGQLLQPPGARTPADLARWMLDLQEGSMHFEACLPADLEPPGRSSPSSPLPVPEAVSLALAAVPHATIRQSWQAVLSTRAFARTPKDSLPEAWGLDTLGALTHEAAKGQRVETLVLDLARQSPAFRSVGFRTLEMLARLNLITLLA